MRKREDENDGVALSVVNETPYELSFQTEIIRDLFVDSITTREVVLTVTTPSAFSPALKTGDKLLYLRLR